MATFFTSDLHFGHLNIIKYCDRPFGDVDEMNAAIVALWNETVQPGDDVWVLGDVAMGQIDNSLLFVGGLNGTKRLVVGNHDRMFGGRQDASIWRGKYYSAGFREIITGETTLKVGDHKVLVSHFPYRGDSHENDRFEENRPVDKGQFLLHGHVHERWRQNERMINVGVDAWAGKPVSENVLVELISAGPSKLEILPWV